MKCRTSAEFANSKLKTKNQWKIENKVPIHPEDGELLWSSQLCYKTYMYYRPDQVREMTNEEKEAYRQEKKKKQKEAKLRKEENHRKECNQKIGEKVAWEVEQATYKIKEEQSRIVHNLANTLIARANKLPIIPCENQSGIVVFDVETTGLDFETDEILQISMIDAEENVLINEYVKPYWTEEWFEAQMVNNISRNMVQDASYPHDLIPKVAGILESAELLVGYNIQFDLRMLENWGISTDTKKRYDVMHHFAPVYGVWDEHFEDYKWQKLTTCADYFGYDFNAHDSLEDVEATLYSYRKLIELENN